MTPPMNRGEEQEEQRNKLRGVVPLFPMFLACAREGLPSCTIANSQIAGFSPPLSVQIRLTYGLRGAIDFTKELTTTATTSILAPIIGTRADTPPMATRSKPVTAEKPKARLRSLADVDRRTMAGRAAFKLRDDLAADLGGWDRLSAMQRELVENTAVLGAMLKDAAAAYLSGDPIDLQEFMALTNAQRRLLADLGLERRMMDVTAPTVRQYLAAKAGAA
jgi:hypothetical protein